MTIVEYVSMTCSHCANFHDATFAALKTNYIDTGKVHYVLREYPIDPLAFGAIMAARCAPGDQYFPIVQALFRNQRRWAFVDQPAPALIAELEPFGFTQDSFAACLKKDDLAQKIIGRRPARRGRVRRARHADLLHQRREARRRDGRGGDEGDPRSAAGERSKN